MYVQVYNICQTLSTTRPHEEVWDTHRISTNQTVDTQNLHHIIQIACKSCIIDPKHANV